MTEESAVKVCVRVRPLIQREQGCGEVVEPVPLYWRADKQAVHQLDDGNLTKTFNFDRVFSADESTNQLYQEIAKPLVVSTVDEGYNGTIFAYGQTSSGKTFTMMGSNCEPGVIPLAMEDVFATIKKCPKKEFLLRVSYMEIYNETVTDLLCDSWKRKPLEIREGNYKNVYVADLTEELVTSAEQALAWIRKGEKNRHYGKTKMNQRSSRSHTIFRMILESRERSDPASGENADGAIIVSHLNLVDLAGAERASQTGAEGARLKEGCNINRSLFTLGQVIKKLSEENQGGFTNYRDSKLTRILQNSLGGNAKTVIVCTITSAAVDETLSTLQFASTAKRMKNDPHVTEVSDDGALLRRYRNEIVDLKRRLEEVSSVTRTTATEKEVLAQLLQEKDQLQREQEDRIRNLTDIIVTSSNFVAVEKKVPKRRVTWGGKLMKGALIDGVHYGDGEFSFAEPSVKKRKGNVSVITDYEGDEFDTRWEIPEEPTFDGEMSQSSVTVRGLSESTFCSPLRVSELSEKVACLEQQLEAEAQEKQEALEAGAALEKRVAELQTQLEAGAALEKRVAELQTQLEAEAQEKQEALEAGAALEKQEALEAGAALEKRVALEAGAALEKRVAELQTQLEAEAQEKQEALEAGAALEKRVVELQTQLEAGAALEKRVAELQTQLEAGAALEKRVAELQTQLEAGAALEKRVVELQTQLQAGAALEKRVVELQTQLEAGAALEKRVVELQTQLEAGAALEKRVVELQTQLEAGAALEKRVVELQTQLEAEAQEKQEALEAGAALEKRVAELQTQLEATATQAAFQEAREEYKKDLGETIQLCEALVSEKANIAAENVLAKRECQLLKEENGALKEENRALKHDKEHLLKEMREKSEQDEFDALEQESAKQYETELMCEIASLKKAAALHPVRVRDLEAELTAMATELKKKEEWITELQSLSGQDLAKQVQQLRRSVDDAEALSRDARKDWAFLRSENLALQERDAMLTADYEKMQKEVQVLQHQLEAEKSRFKNMQNDLQRELLAAFEENAKMTALLDGKVPKSLIDSLELERKAVEMKRELEMAQEREAALQEEVQELVALRELPVKVDQLMRQICDLTDDLCSAQAGKESGEVEVEKLAAILQQTQQQLTDVQDGRRIAEQGAAELKKQLQDHQADNDQLLKSLEDLNQEVVQSREVGESMNEKLRLQQHTVKDLERELSEKQDSSRKAERHFEEGSLLLQDQIQQLGEELDVVRRERDSLLSERADSAQRWEKELEKLITQVTSLTQEREELQEILEGLRDEKNQLKSDLQENEEMVVPVQEELRPQQQNHSEEEQTQLQQLVQSQNEELDRLRAEASQLKCDLQENVEMMIENQEELRVSQEKIREQQKTLQDLEAQIAQLEFKLETSRAGESLPNLKELQNQLQKRAEELEGLRSERNQLKSDLQENVEMMIENQAELRVAQDKISEQQKTMQDLEARVGHMDSKLGNTSAEEILPNLKDLQDHIQQLGVELDVVCRERDSLLSERADSAQRWEEKLETLNLQVTSLTQEREKLQEVLEELRGEKNQLKSNLQKNEEMVVRLQEELRQQQQLTLEQQNLSEEAKTRLQQQVLQLCEELEGLRSERIQLKSDLQDNVEMVRMEMIENQEELRVAQEKIFEQHKTMQNLEAQIGQMDSKLENSRTEESLPNFKDLQNQMKQLGEELDVVCRERDSLLSERTDSAQRWEEKLETLNLQVTSLTREREELQEILEGLRNEKNQLKSVLQENEEMVVQVRKELRQQQQLNLEQQDLREEAQAQLQQRLQKRAEELEGLRSERNQLKSDLQENVEMMIENQEELRVAQDKISEQQKTMQDLEARVGQIWGNENAVESVPNIKDLQNQIQQLGEELDVVCRERDSLLSERTDSAQRWEEELEKLNFQVTSLTREREELQEILEGLRNEKNQLKSDLQENIEMMIENQEELRVSQEKIREQQKTLQDLEAQIAQLEFKLETSRAGESLPNLKELQNQIQQLGVELDVVRSERDSLLSERADSAQRWEEKLGTLNSQVTSLTREREELQEILEGLRNEKNQLKSNLQKNEEMVVQVQEELRLQQQQLTLDQQKLGEEAQIQLQQQLHQQNEELVGLKSERSQLKMDLQQNVEMYAENRRLLHSVQEELKLQLRVNSDLTAQSGERVACLEQQIQQLGVELDVVCRERDSLLSEKADSAQRWEEKLNSQVTSLTQEREKLQEVLEELRGEKNQLKSNLQKNEETVVRLQEELGQQQQLTLEQQKLCVEAQTQLEQQKLCVEAQTRLEQQSSQLLSEANQRPGLSEGTGFRLRHRLQETEKRLQELCEKFQTFRAQGLAAVPELTRPFDEASLAQNELVFRFLHTIPKPTRRLYINFRKSTRDLKDLLVETATAYAGMAKLHWQQCEEQMRHNLACFEEKRIQDLLLPRAKAPAGCLAVPDFQETWDQRLSSLLEKVEVYPQNAYRLAVLKLKEASLNSQTLSSLLAELEEGLAQVLPTLSQELPELERTNAGLRELCAGPSINLPALEDLLQQQLARRTELVQSKKAIYQRLCQQYNRADGKLQSFRVESRREIAGERGRSLALLRTSDTASVQSDVLLVKQLQQAEQTIKTLQEAQAEVERNASSQAEATERLRAQLQEARAQLQERGLSVQTLKEQLEAQKRQGIPPSTAALEEMKSKLVRMELERTALTSSHQEEVESLTALLNHKEEALRKLKETLRKTQSQCDDSFVMDGPSCTKVSTDGKWRNTQSTVQTERAKRQEEELQYLQGLVIGLREEVSKWKGRALNLKNKDLLNHMKSAPSHTPPTKSRCPLTPTKRNLVLDPSKPEHMPTSSPTGLDLAPNLDSPDPEKSTPTSGSPCSPDRGVGGTVGEDKTAEWWPLSPGQQDNCKAQ